MSISTCPHCQNTAFEVSDAEVAGSKQRLTIVRCAKCGAPFGAREAHEYWSLLQEQDARIKNIEHQLTTISTHIAHISRVVGSLVSQHTI